MRGAPVLYSFVSGELSGRLAGRTDISQYYSSAAEIRNMLVEFYGGALKASGTYFVKESKADSEIDYMEYASDATAQAAYVTSTAYTADLCSGGTALESDHSGAYVAANAFNNNPLTCWLSLTPAVNRWVGYDFGSGVVKHIRKITIQQGNTQNTSYLVASLSVGYSDNGADWINLQTISPAVNTTVQTFTISEAGAHRYWRVKALQNSQGGAGYEWDVDEIEMMELPLQSFSKATIKNQGLYSLKGIAVITNSLNATLTRTVSPTISLSGKDTIQFDIFSSRTGANIKVGVHDSGGTTTEKTYTVLATNTWETVSWDVSGVSDANKDAIDSIIITILNADAENIFYIDNFKTVLGSKVRLIPFIFSDTQAYIIELGNYYARFYMNDGQILAGSDPYEIEIPYSEDDIFKVQYAQKHDILYITHPDYGQRKLTRTAHTSWSISAIDYSVTPARPALMDENITSTAITPSAATGNGITLGASTAIFDQTHEGSIWKVNTGYVKIVSVSSGGLKTAAIANVLYGGTLTGTSAYTNWSEGSWSGYRGYPKSVTISEDRLIYGYTEGEPQTTWESETGAYNTFEVGTDDADGMSLKADTNVVEVINWLYPAQEILIGTAGGLHSLGTGSDTLAMTPKTVRIKKRSKDGSSDIIPAQIGNYVYYWQKYNRILREYGISSDTLEYETKDATVFSDHISESGIVDMAYQQYPYNILWCVRDDGKLAAFTRQIEQKVAAWTLHDTQGYYESVAVIPKMTYDEVWFVVRRTIDGITKRYIEYMVAPDFDEQEDMFFVHSGLTIDTPLIILNATQANPVVITSTDHGLSNGNYVIIRGVEGMTELNYRRFKVANKTDNTFELTDTSDANINGTSYTAYESGGEARKGANSVSGLDHLEGKTVQVLVDGDDHTDCMVENGAITLDNYYGQITVGLGYTARLKTNDLSFFPGGENSQGMTKRVNEAIVRVYRSLEFSIGTDEERMDDKTLRDLSIPSYERTPIYTGPVKVPFPSGWDTKKQIVIEQEKCLNLHVLAIVTEGEVN